MLTSEFLSGYLRNADDSFHEDVSEAEPDFHPREFAERFVAYVFSALQSFSSDAIDRILAEIPLAQLEDWFDDLLVREFLLQAPKLAARAARLSPIVARMAPNAPNAPITLYLKEATRAYIFGFWSSSIVLSRAAMEQALKDRLNKGEQGETKLTDLIKEALWTGALDRAHESLASKVQLEGNSWLHGRRGAEPADCAWETLSAARGVISHLFSE